MKSVICTAAIAVLCLSPVWGQAEDLRDVLSVMEHAKGAIGKAKLLVEAKSNYTKEATKLFKEDRTTWNNPHELTWAFNGSKLFKEQTDFAKSHNKARVHMTVFDGEKEGAMLHPPNVFDPRYVQSYVADKNAKLPKEFDLLNPGYKIEGDWAVNVLKGGNFTVERQGSEFKLTGSLPSRPKVVLFVDTEKGIITAYEATLPDNTVNLVTPKDFQSIGGAWIPASVQSEMYTPDKKTLIYGWGLRMLKQLEDPADKLFELPGHIPTTTVLDLDTHRRFLVNKDGVMVESQEDLDAQRKKMIKGWLFVIAVFGALVTLGFYLRRRMAST